MKNTPNGHSGRFLEVDEAMQQEYCKFVGCDPMDKRLRKFTMRQQIERFARNVAFWELQSTVVVNETSHLQRVFAIANGTCHIQKEINNRFDKVIVETIMERANEIVDFEKYWEGRTYRKKQIGVALKKRVWQKEFGDQFAFGKCPCCCSKEIDVWDFETGHVIAECKAGPNKLENLRPICHKCNKGMGSRHWDEYASQFDDLQKELAMMDAVRKYTKMPLPSMGRMCIISVEEMSCSYNEESMKNELRYESFTDIDPNAFPARNGPFEPEMQVLPIILIDADKKTFRVPPWMWTFLKNEIVDSIKIATKTEETRQFFPVKVDIDSLGTEKGTNPKWLHNLKEAVLQFHQRQSRTSPNAERKKHLKNYNIFGIRRGLNCIIPS